VLLTLILGAVYALLNAPTIVQYADQLSVLLDSVKTRDYGAFAAELSKTPKPDAGSVKSLTLPLCFAYA
jgi:hypothetical protein